MNGALSYSARAPGAPGAPGSLRWLSMGGIVLAHLALVLALQHGLLSHAVQIVPKEMIVNLISRPDPLKTPDLPRPDKALPPLAQTFVAPIEVALTQPETAPSIQAVSSTPAPVQPQASPEHAATSATSAPKVISAVEYLQAPRADYPAISRRMGEEGKVVMSVLVNEQGRAEKVEVQKSSGSVRLDEAARLALLRALFKPYIENGKSLTVLATATISFSLSS